MRFFKKEGNVKFRRTNDAKVAEEWVSKGWTEVNPDGTNVAKSSSKPKSKK